MSSPTKEDQQQQQQQGRPSNGLGTLMAMFRQQQPPPSQREEDDQDQQQEEEEQLTDLWGKVHIVRTKLSPSDDGNTNNISNSNSIPSLGSYIINATKKSNSSIIDGGGGDTVTSEITMNILDLDLEEDSGSGEGGESSSEDDDGLYGQIAGYATTNTNNIQNNNVDYASSNNCDDSHGDLTDDGFLNNKRSVGLGDQKRALQQLVRYVQKDNSQQQKLQQQQQQQQQQQDGLDVSRRSTVSLQSLGNISFGVSSVAAHKKRMKNGSCSHQHYHDENEMDEYMMKKDDSGGGGGSSIDEIDDSERQYFDEMKKRVLIPPSSSAATGDIPLKSDDIDSAILGKYKPATKGSIGTKRSQQQQSSSTRINALEQLNQLANNRVENRRESLNSRYDDRVGNRRGSSNSRYSIASTGTFGDISFGVSSVAAHRKRMMKGNNSELKNSLDQSDAGRYSTASNISFGVSSVFAHRKRLMNGNNNGGVKMECNDRGASGGGGTDDSSGDDSYDYFMKQRMDVPTTATSPSNSRPSPPSNTSSTIPLSSLQQASKPSDYQLQKQKQQQRREQRPKDNEYTDTEIDAIIELKLEIANQRTVIDNLSSKLNRALADKKELEEKVEEQNRMLSLDANSSCDATSSIISSIISNNNEDNLIRQLGNSIRSSFMLGQQQQQQAAATPLKGEATTSPSSSSSWGKEKALSSPPASNNINNTSSSTKPNKNDLMLQKQVHELQSMLEYIQHSLQAQKEDSFQKERMYQLQLNELKNLNRELREKNLRLMRDMDDREKASLPSNFPSVSSDCTSRDDGENEEVGGDDDDEGGIEEKEEEEPDSVAVEAAVADLSQLMVQDEKEKEEESLNGGPIAIETKKI